MANNPASLRTALGRVRGLGSARSGTEPFWRQRLTAVANVPLVLIVLGVLIAAAGEDYASALAIVSHPLVAIPMLLFALSATIHMKLGLQTIIEDYVHGEGARLAALIANIFFSVAIGVALIFAIVTIAATRLT